MLFRSGVKSYNKSRPIDIKEFDLEKAWWDNRIENEYAWKVSIKDIQNRGYNLDISNPNKTTKVVNLSTFEIIQRLESSLEKSQQLLSSLKLEFL